MIPRLALPIRGQRRQPPQGQTRAAVGHRALAAETTMAIRAGTRCRKATLASVRMTSRKSRQSRMAQPETPYFDRDEVIACMVIAFCIGNFTLGTIYRLFG